MAAEIVADPAKIELLAKKHDEAAAEGVDMAKAANGTGSSCWVNHGVVSNSSNDSFGTTEEARRAAGQTIRQASIDLAAKLRTAAKVYSGVDEDLSSNLDKQVVPK